jgi:hypothetical protein
MAWGAVTANAVVTYELLPVAVTAVGLLAMRMFAWAGRRDPEEPTATRMSRMPQASTTHADLVRTRMVPSLSFQRN